LCDANCAPPRPGNATTAARHFFSGCFPERRPASSGTFAKRIRQKKRKTRAARKWGARSAGFEGEILAADA
jgi:hypothetical protein